MPRILPRLRQALDRVRNRVPRAQPILPRKIPQKPSGRKLPVEKALASLSIEGRTRSLLFDNQNAVKRRRDYRYQRAPAPRVYGPGLVDAKKKQLDFGASEGGTRRMTEEERDWWSNPYLRMLATPMRQCVLLRKLVPKAFLIRLVSIRIPVPRGARQSTTLIPDGMEHPRFKQRKGRIGYYLTCRKDAFRVFSRSMHVYKRITHSVTLHPQLETQIGHVLRLRALQELQLLADRLQTRPRNATERPVLRRLTRAEWKQIKETGIIPYEGAAAVLVVPPLNKNPETKRRPEPSMSSVPETEETHTEDSKPLPPVSTLHLTVPSQRPLDAAVRTVQYLPPAKVPLYNGLSLFPSRRQRAALHDALNRVLAIERKARWREDYSHEHATDPNNKGDNERAKGDQKASHAYVLYSDRRTVSRVDSVPLAIALWQIRLWEGDGWTMNPDSKRVAAGGWKIIKPFPFAVE